MKNNHTKLEMILSVALYNYRKYLEENCSKEEILNILMGSAKQHFPLDVIAIHNSKLKTDLKGC